MARGAKVRHGRSKNDPTYRSWAAMMKRCHNANYENYRHYGGRGIVVCERWRLFENFLVDMGNRPSEKTLDRFPDNAGAYEPGNTRWATKKEQAANRRSSRITLDIAQEILGRFEHGEARPSISSRLKLSKTSVIALCNGRKWPELIRPWMVNNVSGLVVGRGTWRRGIKSCFGAVKE